MSKPTLEQVQKEIDRVTSEMKGFSNLIKTLDAEALEAKGAGNKVLWMEKKNESQKLYDQKVALKSDYYLLLETKRQLESEK